MDLMNVNNNQVSFLVQGELTKEIALLLVNMAKDGSGRIVYRDHNDQRLLRVV